METLYHLKKLCLSKSTISSMSSKQMSEFRLPLFIFINEFMNWPVFSCVYIKIYQLFLIGHRPTVNFWFRNRRLPKYLWLLGLVRQRSVYHFLFDPGHFFMIERASSLQKSFPDRSTIVLGRYNKYQYPIIWD